MALALVLVVRPLTGYVALAVVPARAARRRAGPGETAAVAFFGVRGVGSLYYLAYATSHEHVPSGPWLWSTVAFTVIVSVLLHGDHRDPRDGPTGCPSRRVNQSRAMQAAQIIAAS